MILKTIETNFTLLNINNTKGESGNHMFLTNSLLYNGWYLYEEN